MCSCCQHNFSTVKTTVTYNNNDTGYDTGYLALSLSHTQTHAQSLEAAEVKMSVHECNNNSLLLLLFCFFCFLPAWMTIIGEAHYSVIIFICYIPTSICSLSILCHPLSDKVCLFRDKLHREFPKAEKTACQLKKIWTPLFNNSQPIQNGMYKETYEKYIKEFDVLKRSQVAPTNVILCCSMSGEELQNRNNINST